MNSVIFISSVHRLDIHIFSEVLKVDAIDSFIFRANKHALSSYQAQVWRHGCVNSSSDVHQLMICFLLGVGIYGPPYTFTGRESFFFIA